jgi:hypothetical protein
MGQKWLHSGYTASKVATQWLHGNGAINGKTEEDRCARPERSPGTDRRVDRAPDVPDPREIERQQQADKAAVKAAAAAQALTVGDVWPLYLEQGRPKRKDAWKPRYLPT